MINKAIEIIKPAITSMAWIERYGGITSIAERTIDTESGLTTQKFPISSSVEAKTCFENNKYLDLVPNDKYFSVAYYEQLSDIETETLQRHKRHKVHKFTTKLRFVAWLNLQKIGITDVTTVADFQTQTINRLLRDHPDAEKKYQQMKASNVRVDRKETTVAVFNQYTYDNLQKLIYYPFDVFSISFDLSWQMQINCAEDVATGVAIDCVDLTME